MNFKKLITVSLFSFSCCSLLLLTAFAKQETPVQQFHESTHLRDTVPDNDTTDDYKVFSKVEIEASFPGGNDAWRRFLERNLDGYVAVKNGAPAGTYTVLVQFIVDKEGNVTDPKALTNHGYGMEAEVIRLLKKAPHWIPAVQDGRKVKAYRKQPVTFMVMEEKKKSKHSGT